MKFRKLYYTVDKHTHYLLIDDQGNVLVDLDYSRLYNLNWINRILVKIFPSYKDRFIDIKTIKL